MRSRIASLLCVGLVTVGLVASPTASAHQHVAPTTVVSTTAQPDTTTRFFATESTPRSAKSKVCSINQVGYVETQGGWGTVTYAAQDRRCVTATGKVTHKITKLTPSFTTSSGGCGKFFNVTKYVEFQYSFIRPSGRLVQKQVNVYCDGGNGEKVVGLETKRFQNGTEWHFWYQWHIVKGADTEGAHRGTLE